MDISHSSAPRPSVARKFALSFGFIAVSVAYAFWQSVSGPRAATLAPVAMPASAPSRPMSNALGTGRYADGSYTGAATDAYYGTVQVKVSIQDGKLAEVAFLQHPDTQQNSRYVNGQAMPLLIQEAIQAQSAKVDGVSGATFTSQAFKQSLASALAQAAS